MKKILMLNLMPPTIADTLHVVPFAFQLKACYLCDIHITCGLLAKEVLAGFSEFKRLLHVPELDAPHPCDENIMLTLQSLKNEKYDKIYVLHPTKGADIAWTIGAKEIFGFSDSGSSMLTASKSFDKIGKRHIADKLMDLLRLDGLNVPSLHHHCVGRKIEDEKLVNVILKTKIPFLKGTYVDDIDKVCMFVGMHTFTKDKTKLWPIEHYINIAKFIINELNGTVILFGSGSEREYNERIVNECGVGVFNTCGLLDIEEACAAMNSCRLFVGNDSGLVHLANACGVDVLVLYVAGRVRAGYPLGVGPVRTISLSCKPSTVKRRIRNVLR